jgi:hypothetical protein
VSARDLILAVLREGVQAGIEAAHDAVPHGVATDILWSERRSLIGKVMENVDESDWLDADHPLAQALSALSGGGTGDGTALTPGERLLMGELIRDAETFEAQSRDGGLAYADERQAARIRAGVNVVARLDKLLAAPAPATEQRGATGETEALRERLATDLFATFGDPTVPGLQRSDFRRMVDHVLAALHPAPPAPAASGEPNLSPHPRPLFDRVAVSIATPSPAAGKSVDNSERYLGRHTCTAADPYVKTKHGTHSLHPDARRVGGSNDGACDDFECPNCGTGWRWCYDDN